MSEISTLDDLLANQRKEKKDLVAKTQKMKHGVPKGDKKKKKEVTAEITQLLAEMDLKHETEVKEFVNTYNPDPESSNNSMPENGVNDLQSVTKDKVDNSEKEENKNGAVPRMSKAQKRRNKKTLMEKERIKAIEEQELENLNGLRHIESQEIERKLSKRQLAIHEIPSDGNCLYKAVEHQLSSLNAQQTTVKSLRELTSKYMLNHMEDYIPFMTSPETGDTPTKEQYIKYCEDIANTTAWGGHIEVQALSHVCGMPIEIIQAEGPSIIAGNEESNPKLILSHTKCTCMEEAIVGMPKKRRKD